MKSRDHTSGKIAGLAVLGVVVLAGLLQAGQPELVCDEPEFKFPPTENTEEITHTFVLRNDGMAPLSIARVQSDCGCMLVRPPPGLIEPGDEFEIEARFILKGRQGPQRRRITLHTNDPRQSRLVLRMTGEILAAAMVRPERIFWGNIRHDTMVEHEATVEFHGAHHAGMIEASIANREFEVEVDVITAGRVYRLNLRAIPPLTPGRFHFPVEIKTDHPRVPELALEMSGRVVEAVYAIPDEIVLDQSVKRPVTVLIMLRAATDEKFNVLEVITPVEGLECRSRAMTRGMRVELREVRATPELDGETVHIITDHPEVPEVRIPIRLR